MSDHRFFRRENLRFVVEGARSGEANFYYWVYQFGKSLYVRGLWPPRCHHSVQSVESLTRWIERKHYTRVIRVIPEKDLKSEASLRKHEGAVARSQGQESVSLVVHFSTKQAFMARLRPHAARIVGSTPVVAFKSPRSNIQWASKKRSRP